MLQNAENLKLEISSNVLFNWFYKNIARDT